MEQDSIVILTPRSKDELDRSLYILNNCLSHNFLNLVKYIRVISDLVTSELPKEQIKTDLLNVTKRIMVSFCTIEEQLSKTNSDKFGVTEKESLKTINENLRDNKTALVEVIRFANAKVENNNIGGEFESAIKAVLLKLKILIEANKVLKRDIPPSLEGFNQRSKFNFSGLLRREERGATIDRPPVVLDSGQYVVEPHGDQLETPVLNMFEDAYANEFYPSNHYNFIGMNSDICECIVSVMKTPVISYPNLVWALDMGTSYKAIITHKKGADIFTINSLALAANTRDIEKVLEDLLNARAHPGYSYYSVVNSNISDEILKIEQRHSQKITQLKVAVLYVIPGQTDLPEIFQNQPDPSSGFYSWLDSIANKISLKDWKYYRGDFNVESDRDSYYTVWKGIEVMFHIAPWLNSEQHRGLIGNDICFIIYFDTAQDEPFNPTPMLSLGTVPQIFTVVQPCQSAYRLGFFHRSTIKAFSPSPPPLDYLLSVSDMKDYLFTKLHNGFVMSSLYCPPMNRLFTTPRADTIKNIGETFPRETKKARSKVVKDKTKKIKQEREQAVKRDELLVYVIAGRNLVSRDSNGLSDPYCVIHLLDQREKTQVQRKTLNPHWASLIRLNLVGCNKDTDAIEIMVMDWDRFSSDDYMGELSIPIKDAIKTKEPHWYPLISKTNEKITGDIQLQFEMVPNTWNHLDSAVSVSYPNLSIATASNLTSSESLGYYRSKEEVSLSDLKT